MFRCVDNDGDFIAQLDTIDNFNITLDTMSFVQLTNTCFDDDIEVQYDVDPTNVEEFRAYLDEYDRECEDLGGHLAPVRDTRIEGFVYVFNPSDPGNIEGAPWVGTPVKDVTVRAKGITFNIFWGTDDNGAFYFDNLGAGPILLNLDLPPNGHMLNPNLLVKSAGTEQVWRNNNLGFYYGDYRPRADQLITPGGLPLPFLALDDIEELSACGYDDLPAVAASYEPPVIPANVLADTPEIPEVGAELPQKTSVATLLLAAALLILLPVAGIIRIRRYN